MRRILIDVLRLCVTLIAGTKLMERLGVLNCRCSATCWCHRPGLGLFRWVIPVSHQGDCATDMPASTGPT